MPGKDRGHSKTADRAEVVISEISAERYSVRSCLVPLHLRMIPGSCVLLLLLKLEFSKSSSFAWELAATHDHCPGFPPSQRHVPLLRGAGLYLPDHSPCHRGSSRTSSSVHNLVVTRQGGLGEVGDHEGQEGLEGLEEPQAQVEVQSVPPPSRRDDGLGRPRPHRPWPVPLRPRPSHHRGV